MKKIVNKKNMIKTIRWIFIFILSILLLIFIFIQYSRYKIYSTSPEMPLKYISHNLTVSNNDSLYQYGENWAKLNQYGIWEVYLKGEAFDRGLAYGKLIKDPIQYQEKVFVESINKILPSKIYQWLIKNLIYLFNSNINNYISEELKKEILGTSLSFSDKYDYIGKKYLRIIAYHAAHDLGHALNNYSLIGCTSFAVNRNNTEDGDLIHARNFDFYFGDDFAKKKVLLMVKPDSGYAFASYSWPGMMGVVSGMNEKGLAITINASMSSPPTSAKLPISILIRETLQFSKNLTEAIKYISNKSLFVSESIMISSATDNKCIIIEKTPNKQDIFYSSNGLITCSNHFQSPTFINDSINIYNINNSNSRYRLNRVNDLLNQSTKINVETTINILRNKSGHKNKDIGLGNPHAINQFLAHHGIVFEPNKKNIWLSTPPYQLGDFICYNLDSIFLKQNTKIINTIKKDPFIDTKDYRMYKQHRLIRDQLNDYIIFDYQEPHFDENTFIKSNPKSYNTYFTLGKYYYKKNDFKKAKNMFYKSLSMDLPSKSIKNEINYYIDLCSQ